MRLVSAIHLVNALFAVQADHSIVCEQRKAVEA